MNFVVALQAQLSVKIPEEDYPPHAMISNFGPNRLNFDI
jgi:hypothetical protein